MLVFSFLESPSASVQIAAIDSLDSMYFDEEYSQRLIATIHSAISILINNLPKIDQPKYLELLYSITKYIITSAHKLHAFNIKNCFKIELIHCLFLKSVTSRISLRTIKKSWERFQKELVRRYSWNMSESEQGSKKAHCA